jgi:glycosyltransferase involved in cell wall biosynthesis
MDKIGVIVPAWNEERDIQCVLDAVGPIEWLEQIVVVDDGSSDATPRVALDCAEKYPRMSVLQLPQNQGKGSAMLAGLRALPSEVDTVVFIDADLIGLTENHLKALIRPVKNHDCEMSVAIFKKGYWRTDISQKFAPNLNGQRCLPLREAEEALIPLVESGYGVEIGLTLYARRKKWRIQYVDWPGMSHDMKEHKLGLFVGYRVRAMMYRQILVAWIRGLK